MINEAQLNLTSVEEAYGEVEANERMPMVEMSIKLAVEEAWRPARNQIGVVVEFAAAAKLVVGVYEKEPPPVPQAVPVFEITPVEEN